MRLISCCICSWDEQCAIVVHVTHELSTVIVRVCWPIIAGACAAKSCLCKATTAWTGTLHATSVRTKTCTIHMAHFR